MNVVIASDKSGFPLKEAVKKHLLGKGYTVFDVGQQSADEATVTHIDAARELSRAMKDGKSEKGIIFCGTGAGASMSVNKIKGMYCVACESMFSAPKISIINNANVLAMGARIVGPENGCEMAETFLNESFAHDFGAERKQTVETLYKDMVQLESENFK
ncbi:MAG: RpiB/LacA/LacB family sugar-phosphate isomerase [Candidatus Accumulibacter sp.]|nr:RpiB/LacA/LacB family sugar-phosphate isomerase [Accumulibacter sp.]